MRKNLLIIFFILILTPLISQVDSPESWNQFRGLNRNGISKEVISLKENFAQEGARLIWERKLGAGFSEVLVEEDRIYTLFGEQKDSLSGTEYLICMDANSGETLWQTKLDSLFFDTFGNGPRSTPVLGEKDIFSLSSYGKLTSVSKDSGELNWQIDIVKDFGTAIPRWGFSSSPILIGNTLVVETGGSESKAFSAFDISTGKMLWSKGEGVATYCSPLFVNIDGVEQILFANQRVLYSLNAKGDTLWTHLMSTVSPTAMPLIFEENKIFISSLAAKGFSVLEVKGQEVKEILTGRTMKNDFSSSLYYNGHFYGFNVAAFQCISAETGEKKWTKRGLGKGSLILVDNKLLVLSDKGKLVVVEASPDQYTELGNFQALIGKSWTAPSYAGARLFVRNLEHIACYSLID